MAQESCAIILPQFIAVCVIALSRHCHLAIQTLTIRQRVFDCNYLSCRICFNVLNYVFILFIINLYCLVNIQQHCRNSRYCDTTLYIARLSLYNSVMPR